MSEFFYDVERYDIRRHKTTGKILEQGWRPEASEYDTLEEALADNPPGKYRLRFIKKYYEIVQEQEAQE